MRITVLVTGDGRVVLNSASRMEKALVMLSDRRANAEASPGEHAVRLPRRLCRAAPWEGRDGAWRRANAGALSREEWMRAVQAAVS